MQTFPDPTSAAGLSQIVAGPDGALWYSEDNAYQVGRITTSGQITETAVTPQYGSIGDGGGPGPIVSSGGRLWFLSDSGALLYALTPGGAPVVIDNDNDYSDDDLAPAAGGGVWATTADGYLGSAALSGLRLYGAAGGPPQQFPAQYDGALRPVPMAAGAAGSVWFADDGDYLRNETPAGTSTSYPTTLPSSAGYVNSIALDRAGDTWFAAYFPGDYALAPYGGGIGELRPGASSATLVDLGPNVEQVAPHSIVLGPDGALWFAWSNGVGRVDPATGAVQYATIPGVNITDMTFGPDGNLWFVDAAANDIGRITTSTIFPGSSGSAPSATKPRAPSIAVHVTRTSLRALGRHPVLTVRCHLAAAGRCSARLVVSARVARSLGITPRRHATTVTLARAAHTFTQAGTATLRLRFPAAARRRLVHAHRIKLSLVVTSTASGDTARTVRRTITLSR